MLTIDVHYSREKPAQIEVYRRCARQFARCGFALRFRPDREPDPGSDADAFVLQDSFAPSDIASLARPIVIEERADSAMPQTRKLAGAKEVVAIAKVSLVRPEWFNHPVKRVHTWLLDQVPTWPHQPKLSPESAAKYVPGITFGMYDRMKPWVRRSRGPAWKDRPVDVLFMGTTEYSVPSLSEHRRRFCAHLQSISGLNIVCSTGRTLGRGKYFALSRTAKIIVSPWGYGELCYRDFEALFDECVLVKPDTSFLSVLGGLFEGPNAYQRCAMDGSDLERIVRRVLADPQFQSGMPQRELREAAVHWWDKRVIATWWAQAIGPRIHAALPRFGFSSRTGAGRRSKPRRFASALADFFLRRALPRDRSGRPLTKR